MKVALLGSEWVLYLLIVLSVLSVGVVVERQVRLHRDARGRRGLRTRLIAALPQGDAPVAAVLAEHPCVETRVLTQALQFQAGGPEAIAEAVQGALAVERLHLERGTTFLGTVGNNAPFIGLFGTVIGVIAAFHHLGDGSDAAMGLVMAGIAEALVATGVGIFVAIPAVIAFNIAQKYAGDVENESVALGQLVAAAYRGRPSVSEARGPSPEATSLAAPRNGVCASAATSLEH